MGSGWLGLPVAEKLVADGHQVKLSTTTTSRLPELEATGASAHLVKLETVDSNMQSFLASDVLIINITSKNIEAFDLLIPAIEASTVSKVLFVSSTSVYRSSNKEVSEDDGEESADSSLFQIENLFRASDAFETTIIRFAGLVGGRRHPGRFFRNAKQVRFPEARINLIHLDDCIEVISRIIERNVWAEVFSACSDTHPLKREFYTAAANSLAMPIPDFADSEETSFKIINNDKMKRILGIALKYPDMLQMLDSSDAFIIDDETT